MNKPEYPEDYEGMGGCLWSIIILIVTVIFVIVAKVIK